MIANARGLIHEERPVVRAGGDRTDAEDACSRAHAVLLRRGTRVARVFEPACPPKTRRDAMEPLRQWWVGGPSQRDRYATGAARSADSPRAAHLSSCRTWRSSEPPRPRYSTLTASTTAVDRAVSRSSPSQTPTTSTARSRFPQPMFCCIGAYSAAFASLIVQWRLFESQG